MLDQVDELIRAVLLRDLNDVLQTGEQVRFQPPDDDLRTAVANLGRNVLSVYLVDVRENRSLRQPEWQVTFDASGPHREVSPARVDCHYLISAWSPATLTPAIEPTLDEHALLYRAMAALFRVDPLNPSQVYPAGSAALLAVNPLIRDADLPTRVAPADGWPKLGEFWAAMGPGERWRPILWFTVTIPVAFTRQIAGPLVTTRIIEFRQAGKPETAEQWLQIGGTVTDSSGKAVADASVQLAGAGGVPVGAATTDAAGRFTLGALAGGGYRITAAKPGTGHADGVLAVPDPSGDYDISLT